MKKAISIVLRSLIGIGALLMAMPLWGQAYRFRPATVEVGVGGGRGVAMFQFVPRVDQSLLQVNTFSLDFRHSNQDVVSLHTRLAYQERGWLEPAKDEKSEAYSHKSSYIDMAFYASFQYSVGRWNAGLDLGPQVGYRLFSEYPSENKALLSEATERRAPSNIFPVSMGLSVAPFVAWNITPRLRWEFSVIGYYALLDFLESSLTSSFSRSAEISLYGTTTLYFRF